MTKRMLIDASHPEETRVVVLDGTRIEEFDLETATRRALKGNIYLAKVVRVEPSLQAAFVEYGGNRHGFLAFGEIHPDYYQIPVADRQRLIEMQAEDARAEEDADLPPESAMDRAAWNGEGAEGWTNGEGAAEADPAAPPAGDAAAADSAAAQDTPAADKANTPTAAAPDAGAEAIDPPADATGAAADVPAPAAAQSALPLDMAADRISAAPDADLTTDAAEPADAPEADTTDAGHIETLAGDEPPPPPETIGGEDMPAETDDERRERRIPPRFLRHYKIQEVIKRRQIMLVQVVKEERGGKGAALTTYISLAGRFSVLMPNSPRGGGVSRKITSAGDRKRLREAVEEMNMPEGMSLIVRTAGAQRPKPEIKRDCEYLLRLWDSIRERTLASSAPALIYEEADLIKRSIRDVYGRDIEEVVVEGEDAYSAAREFMRMLMPANAGKIRAHREAVPLFARHAVDQQLDAMHSPIVQLKSGGYIVINQTEALVAIDVNSGRATRDRHIEDTALRTNLEAADEIARQLRLRDLAGLIVIDFIDMESAKHDGMVERRMKDALKQDRARIQVGRISHFGLLEMSRQRLRPSIAEQTFVPCPHCQGRGLVRSVESSALQVLRAIEEEGAKRRAAEIVVHAASPVALWLLNRKRERLAEIEQRFGMAVMFEPDDTLMGPAVKIDRIRAAEPGAISSAPSALRMDYAPVPAAAEADAHEDDAPDAAEADEAPRQASARRRPDGSRRSDQRPPRGADADALSVADDDAPRGAEDDAARGTGDDASRRAGDDTPRRAGDDTPRRAGDETRAETAEEGERRRRRRRRRRGGRREDGREGAPETEGDADASPETLMDGEAEPGAEAEPAAAANEGEGEEGADPGQADGGLDADGRRRRRGRRGGRRRREDGTAPEAAAAEQPEEVAAPAPAPRPARYTGPTPADPFAGQIDDIFEAMAAAEAAAERAATARPPRVGTPTAIEAQAEVTAVTVVETPAPELPAEAPPPPVVAPVADAAPAPEAAPATPPAQAAPEAPLAAPVAIPAAAKAAPAAAPATPEPTPAEPVIGAPVQPVLLGTGVEAALPKRQGWWKR
jgi:ribonuclease E